MPSHQPRGVIKAIKMPSPRELLLPETKPSTHTRSPVPPLCLGDTQKRSAFYAETRGLGDQWAVGYVGCLGIKKKHAPAKTVFQVVTLTIGDMVFRPLARPRQPSSSDPCPWNPPSLVRGQGEFQRGVRQPRKRTPGGGDRLVYLSWLTASVTLPLIS